MSIHRHGPGWRVKIEAPRRPDGRRKYVYATFPAKKEAERWEIATKAKLQRGDFVEVSRETVAEYLRRWLPIAEARGLRPSTVLGYRLALEKQVIPRIGGLQLQKLTAADLNSLYAELLRQGHRQRKGRGLAPRTVRYIHTIVHRALADAVKWQLLHRNVADAADPPSAKSAKEASRKRTFWDEAQLRRFLEATSAHRLHPAFRLVAMTGMRRGELLGLRWSDLDLTNGRLRVEQTLIAPGYRSQFSSPKTAHGRRTVDLDEGTVHVLRGHRRAQAEEQLAAGSAYQPCELVFRDERGRPLVPALFSLAFDKAVRDADLPRIRLHDLRHTHVALLGRAGVPVKVVQERVGHADPGFTLREYGGTFAAQHREAADAFARLVGDE